MPTWQLPLNTLFFKSQGVTLFILALQTPGMENKQVNHYAREKVTVTEIQENTLAAAKRRFILAQWFLTLPVDACPHAPRDSEPE